MPRWRPQLEVHPVGSEVWYAEEPKNVQEEQHYEVVGSSAESYSAAGANGVEYTIVPSEEHYYNFHIHHHIQRQARGTPVVGIPTGGKIDSDHMNGSTAAVHKRY